MVALVRICLKVFFKLSIFCHFSPLKVKLVFDFFPFLFPSFPALSFLFYLESFSSSEKIKKNFYLRILTWVKIDHFIEKNQDSEKKKIKIRFKIYLISGRICNGLRVGPKIHWVFPPVPLRKSRQIHQLQLPQ